MSDQIQLHSTSTRLNRGSTSSIRILSEQAFLRAAGAPLISGNSIRILKDARENYPAWLGAIGLAQRTIHFESYIIHEDERGVEPLSSARRGKPRHQRERARRARLSARGCGSGRGRALHVYNVHLGTSFIERRHQARKLLSESILSDGAVPGPRIMLGDFNEWTRGLATRMLTGHFQSGDIRLHLRRTRTYPGVLPFLHLDHIYFDETLELEHAELHRSRAALIASDHLPIFADFTLRADSAG